MKAKDDVRMGDKLRLRRNGEERLVEVTDFPGDRSLITLEPSLLDDPKAIICGVEEVDDGDDPTPIEVGWHISTTGEGDEPWEIVEIVRGDPRVEETN